MSLSLLLFQKRDHSFPSSMTSLTHGQTGLQVFVFDCGTHLIFTNVQLISCNKINRQTSWLKIKTPGGHSITNYMGGGLAQRSE